MLLQHCIPKKMMLMKSITIVGFVVALVGPSVVRAEKERVDIKVSNGILLNLGAGDIAGISRQKT